MTVIQAHWSRFVVHTADVPKITEMWWCDSTFIEKSFKNSTRIGIVKAKGKQTFSNTSTSIQTHEKGQPLYLSIWKRIDNRLERKGI